MNEKKLLDFLQKFDLSNDIIKSFISDRKIVEREGNFFLKKEPFLSKEVYDDTLLFIKLRDKSLPSTFLFSFINQNSKNSIEVSDKQALNFTYGKDIPLNSFKSKRKFAKERFYLIINQNKVLGYCSLNLSKKVLANDMNIGQYLRE